VKIGDSSRLGKYVVLRDVYGDVFTYAGLGSIASSYSLAKSASGPAKSPVVEAASSQAPTPTQPASAGTQSPPTLHVETSLQSSLVSSGLGQISMSSSFQEEAPARKNKARVAAGVAHTARNAKQSTAGENVELRRGSVVASGTVLGHVHLYVDDIAKAEAFYHDALGFDKVVWSYPGALFMSAGGYHHHLGTNTWARGAPPATDADARLLEWEIIVPTKKDAEDAARHVKSAGYPVKEGNGEWILTDPWGTSLRLVPEK